MSHHLTKIFDAWDGNAEAMATDIEEQGVTVRQWRNRGKIPSDYWPKIIRSAAEKRSRVLRVEDFFPPEALSDLPVHETPDTSAEISGSPDNGSQNIGEAQAA